MRRTTIEGDSCGEFKRSHYVFLCFDSSKSSGEDLRHALGYERARGLAYRASNLSSSAVHVDLDAGNVRSILGRKKCDSRRNFLLLPEALHRYLLNDQHGRRSSTEMRSRRQI